MIIVVGKRQPRSKRINCDRCGALLEYCSEDVRIGSDKLAYVGCPVRSCRSDNYVGTADSYLKGNIG